MYVYASHDVDTRRSGRLDEGTGSSATVGTHSCELPCGFREPNEGSLQEQQVLLVSEPFLQPWVTHFYVNIRDRNFNKILLTTNTIF